MRATISVNITDAHLGIWQHDANDPSFRAEIYGGLIREMRKRGWSARQCAETRKHYPILGPLNRMAARGNLRAKITVSGRVVEIDFWATTWPLDNRNGRQYDFRRMERMRHIDQLRVELEYRRIIAWLETLASVKIERRDNQHLTPMQRIAKDYAESWHSDKALGRPVCKYDSNRKTGDGNLLEHGQTVWFRDAKGRVCRGTAYYNINNMWWVVAGSELRNQSCSALLVAPPTDLRSKQNDRARRNKLEQELALAVERMDFQRAHTLKTVLFGREATFMIWARDHSAYYRSQYAGYTTDRISAGKYTLAEAEAECRRAPDELEMVSPDGSHVRFDRSAA